jgi:biofilm PGA synthesis N-glycosyltransferase PgaC
MDNTIMEVTGLIFWLSSIFILYVYLGYPLFLFLLAKLYPRLPEYPLNMPNISLLIAAYNEQDVINAKLENVLALDYPIEKLQIIVVADGSSDNTPDIVRSYMKRGVELSYQPERRGKMAAINRAIPIARNEIIVFSDANNMYSPKTLRELVKPFSEPRVGGVSGSKNLLDSRDALTKADSLYWQYESFIKTHETRLGSCTGVSGEILAIRTSLFQAPPDWIINDDFFISMNILKQGYKVVYAPEARSFEYSSLTEKDEATRRSRIVAGRYQAMLLAARLLPWRNPILVWQIISHKMMRPLVPFAMIIAFLSNLLAVILPPIPLQESSISFLSRLYSQILFSLQLIFYMLALLGNKLKRKSFLGKVLYVPAFLVNSNLSAIRGLVSFFTGKQSALWKRTRRRGEPVR